MPRNKITVNIVRTPTKLAAVLNDMQRQISRNRQQVNSQVSKLEEKCLEYGEVLLSKDEPKPEVEINKEPKPKEEKAT